MPRRKITDEAKEKASETPTDSTETERESSTSSTTTETNGAEESTDESDREQLTQRMPGDLVEDIDEFADRMGFGSRNAAINFLVRQALDDFS